MSDLDNLPRLAQDYTPEQREACVAYLADLDLTDLRQRQAIKNEEIARAVTRNLPEEIIVSLQEQDQQLADAVRRKAFG